MRPWHYHGVQGFRTSRSNWRRCWSASSLQTLLHVQTSVAGIHHREHQQFIISNVKVSSALWTNHQHTTFCPFVIFVSHFGFFRFQSCGNANTTKVNICNTWLHWSIHRLQFSIICTASGKQRQQWLRTRRREGRYWAEKVWSDKRWATICTWKWRRRWARWDSWYTFCIKQMWWRTRERCRLNICT